MANKEETLAALRAEFDAWESLLAGWDETQFTNPFTPEGWSMKDELAHLRDWQKRSIARAEGVLLDKEPQFPAWPPEQDPEQEGEPHDLNAWLYAQSREQPWPEIYQEWRTGFLRLLELGAAIPEADLFDSERFAWLDGHSISVYLDGSREHHAEHRVSVEG